MGEKMDKKVLIIIIAIIAIIIIIPVVLISGLVVTGLSLQVMNQGSNLPETNSKTAWKSSEPFGLVDWSQSSPTTLTVILKNNTADTLTISKMNLTNSIQSGDVGSIPAYGKKVITFTTPSCNTGSKYAYPKSNIVITYASTNISGKTMGGVADIVGTC